MPGPDGPDPAAELRQADAEANGLFSITPLQEPPCTDTLQAESSESEDQFTDAQSAPMSPNGRESPLPTARAEKVNDNPTDSETSGNDIQEERHEDAQPDEATVIPDEGSQPVSPSIAGDTIPETVVEEAASTSQHSVAHESKLNADASPVEANEDESHDSTGTAAAGRQELYQSQRFACALADNPPLDESASSPSVTADNTTHQGGESSQSQALAVTTAKEDNGEDDNEAFGDEAFGDDFDDFEEGGGEDDFDFDESFAQPEPQEAAAPAPPLVQQASLPFVRNPKNIYYILVLLLTCLIAHTGSRRT
jgi:hypothetical protein